MIRMSSTARKYLPCSWINDVTDYDSDPRTIIGRNWITVDRHFDSDCDSESGVSVCSSSASSMAGSTEDLFTGSRNNRKFRIATYNILTDNCIRPGEYLYCPSDVLYMSSRHVRIVAEVKSMAPDVVCFQEVDYAHYKTRLQPSMRRLGYDGILLQRQDDQGLATFWKNDRFELQQQKHVTLHHAAETYLQMTEMAPNDMNVARQCMERPEALLLIRLRHLSTNILLAVANIHVTWSALKFPALQALQISIGTSELCDFVRGYQCAQILCGDFNTPPGSVPYQMLSGGQLDDVMATSLKQSCSMNDQIDRLRAAYLFDVLPLGAFTINARLQSAYKTVLGAEPDITNCDEVGVTELCKLCLDYIWFSPQSLQVTGVLETPPSELITKHYGLPSVDFPSDHIPLMAEFVFK